MLKRLFAAALLAAFVLRLEVHSSEIAVAWNDFEAERGIVRAIRATAPWDFVSDPLVVGRQPVLRYAEGKLFALSGMDSTLTVVDPGTWTIERTYPLGAAGSDAIDIAIADKQTAYLTRQNATHLQRLDLIDGTSSDVLDLSVFADPDGIPDLGTMSLHENRLFVQIQRRNVDGPQAFFPPAFLAVMDTTTEQLIDVDPQLPGTQAIQLAGTAPKLKMQVVRESQQLFVSASGTTFDEGGLEAIRLDTLQSQGLVIRESDGATGADLGPVVMVSPQRGFLATTTDLLPSSHLHMFSLDGVVPEQLEVAVDYLAPAIEYDWRSNSIFFPFSSGLEHGIHVFDADTGERLNERLIALGGAPSDVALVPEPSAGLLPLACAALTVAWARHRRRR